MEGRETLYVFGDPAYTAAFGTACPFEHPLGRFALREDERQWNAALSSARIEVERSFGRVQTTWTYTAFGKGLRAGIQPVAAYFVAAVLLTNMQTCIRGQTRRNRFGLTPPTVESYLQL
jgi:hypothetical protein